MGRRMRSAAATAGLWLLALGSLLALWGGLLPPRTELPDSRPPEDGLPQRPARRGGHAPVPRFPLPPPLAWDARGGSLKTFRALLTLAAGADSPPRRHPGERRRHVPSGRPGLAERAAVHEGVFWSRGLDEQVPRGFSEAQAAAWLEAARSARVVALERGGCGRSSNRLARFADGTRACVRYGINPEQIQVTQEVKGGRLTVRGKWNRGGAGRRRPRSPRAAEVEQQRGAAQRGGRRGASGRAGSAGSRGSAAQRRARRPSRRGGLELAARRGRPRPQAPLPDAARPSRVATPEEGTPAPG
uniref:four-jointed box protein 1 n=1 Tax=Urocitellus parryii TaxID=9999 RepID=UPI000E55933E|nr:four-jointed box protein 1 [Urocitellus parryii]